jgi:hypothetical protein
MGKTAAWNKTRQLVHKYELDILRYNDRATRMEAYRSFFEAGWNANQKDAMDAQRDHPEHLDIHDTAAIADTWRDDCGD